MFEDFKLATMIINFSYAIFGGIITIIFMMLSYKIFDIILPFNMNTELDDGNVAIGIVVGSIFIGVGLAVGLSIGLALN